jgi:DNA (cytosine-5)-methyltransferase 1
MLFFTKAKRAQNVNDYESWKRGGVVPTLNAMDNNGEAYATVLILFEPKSLFEENWSESKVKNALRANASKSSHLIIDGTRVDDVRVYEDGIVPTVISRYGTGGGNVPMVFPIDDARELEKHQNGTGIGAEGAPAYTLDRQQAPAVVAVDFYNASTGDTSQTLRAHTATAVNIGGVIDHQVVRRLTPVECERLQGFPDGWTDGQADSNRYKQMGNAVAVPVVQWIINRMVEQIGE